MHNIYMYEKSIVPVRHGAKVCTGLTYIENGSVAVSASRRKQIVIVGLAIGLRVALEKVLCSKLLPAMDTCEVFRMPSSAQGCNNLAHNRLLTSKAVSFCIGVDSVAAHV